jgi:hypothetical protein
MTDFLAKLAALTANHENGPLSERLRELANAIQVWDGETPAAKLLFDAADRLSDESALIALVQEAAAEIERLSKRRADEHLSPDEQMVKGAREFKDALKQRESHGERK